VTSMLPQVNLQQTYFSAEINVICLSRCDMRGLSY